MATSRAQLLKELVPGLKVVFGTTYKMYPEQWRSVYQQETSDRSFEEELKNTGFGIAREKQEGAGVTYDEMQEAYTIRYIHETVALGFSFTEEAMEDNLYESVGTRGTRSLARSFAETKNIKAMKPFNLGFSTAFKSGDDVAMFSTAHPLVNGATNANRPVTGADLNETSLEAAIISMAAWVDDRGILVNANVKGLMIPPALTFTAHRVLKSSGRPGTMDNDDNALRSMNSIPGGVSVNNYLTDTNAWFLSTDVPNGMKYYQRVKLKTDMTGDFDTGNVKYKGRERYVFGVSDPLAVYGSPGST